MYKELSGLDSKDQLENLIAHAEEAISQNDWAEATKNLQKIFITYKEKTPPQVYILMSMVHRIQGKPDKSEKIIRQAILRYPNNIGILTEHAKIAEVLKNTSGVAQRIEDLNQIKMTSCKDKQHHKHHIKRADSKLKSYHELCKKINELLSVNFKSIVDVGCGYGYFLYEAKKLWNIQKALGIDGPWIEKKHLQISKDEFVEIDLESDKAIEKLQSFQRFDLAASLEVGEHLEKKHAHKFIKLLTSLSDLVIFSAAIPEQEGQGHVNEQWPSYWADLFQIHNFVPLDILRGEIWYNTDIDLCLRQNILLFVNKKNNIFADIKFNNALDLVHPEFYYIKQKRIIKLYSNKINELNEKSKI